MNGLQVFLLLAVLWRRRGPTNCGHRKCSMHKTDNKQREEGDFRAMLSMSIPSLINCYWREYYVSADGETRLTLDSELKAYNQLFYRCPNLHYQIMPQLDAVIIEVKARSNNARLSEILAGFPLRVDTYSKYVHAMGMV